MGIKKRWCLTILAVILVLSACTGIKQNGSDNSPVRESEASDIHEPGTIASGVYLSPMGDFTVNADPNVWNVKQEDGAYVLQLREDDKIWISFSKTEGLTSAMLEDFETSFAQRYMEGIRAGYPDAQLLECKTVTDFLARIDMTMSYGSGLYSMYQIMYLATDGQDGYIITATLPVKKAKRLCPAVYGLVESLVFIED